MMIKVEVYSNDGNLIITNTYDIYGGELHLTSPVVDGKQIFTGYELISFVETVYDEESNDG